MAAGGGSPRSSSPAMTRSSPAAACATKLARLG